MRPRPTAPPPRWPWAALSLLGASAAGCLDRTFAPDDGPAPPVELQLFTESVNAVDLLFAIDNSGSMRENQAQLARRLDVLLSQLVDAAVDPRGGRIGRPPARSLHVGVISVDLGTPGSVLGGCAHSDAGDDGLLNPIRNGQAMRTHQPWTTAPPGIRPARCRNDPQQYPNFLTFDADATAFHEDLVCNTFLSIGGCGIEQQLEAAYRALVIRDPRARPGNTDPNAGFVRDEAVLALVMVTDEEDGSVRDCRYEEPGDPDGDCRPPRGDALSVFDSSNRDWADTDFSINLRWYMYTPGSPQDPTWNLNRYLDPARPTRGFLSLKPGHPERVVFAGLVGVPVDLPTRPDGGGLDWTALLGENPDGSDGYTAMSPEGPVSLRQRNLDPSCGMRVVPGCRREGVRYDPDRPPCDTTAQYFAWPSRRIPEIARRFAALYDNGTIRSICRRDFAEALEEFGQRIRRRLVRRCLAHPLVTVPPRCTAAGEPLGCVRPGDLTPVRVNCILRETLPESVPVALGCSTARGRRTAGTDPDTGRGQCLVDQVALPVGTLPTAASPPGFFYDTTTSPGASPCRHPIAFTARDEPLPGTTVQIECTPESVGEAAP